MKFWQQLRQVLRPIGQKAETEDRSNSADDDAVEPISEALTDAGYYEAVSSRYALAQLIGIVLLAVFLALSLLTDASMLSADHLAYFVKDMTSSISLRESVAHDTLVYAADADGQYVLFRNGLAAVGKDRVTVFTATGRQAYDEHISYATPRAVASGRYLLVYDLGGKEYSLYNSFACVNSVVTEYSIRGGAAANNGNYCVITEDAEYASEVCLYNDRFQLINRYRMEEYTVCAALTEAGDRLALASLGTEQGRMITHIMTAVPGRDVEQSSFTVENAYPVALAYTDERELLLLTTDALYCFDEEGKELGRYAFDAERITSFKLTQDGCVLLGRATTYDATTQVVAIDKRGQVVYNIMISDVANSAAFDGELLGVLTQDMVYVYEKGETQPCDLARFTGEYRTLLSNRGGEFLLCGEAKTIVVRLNTGK